jgi:hypothetical protein
MDLRNLLQNLEVNEEEKPKKATLKNSSKIKKPSNDQSKKK